MENKPTEEIIDEAVRDICSVSLTAAPKSKVRKILLSIANQARQQERQRLVNSEKKICLNCNKEAYILWCSTEEMPEKENERLCKCENPTIVQSFKDINGFGEYVKKKERQRLKDWAEKNKSYDYVKLQDLLNHLNG